MHKHKHTTPFSYFSKSEFPQEIGVPQSNSFLYKVLFLSFFLNLALLAICVYLSLTKNETNSEIQPIAISTSYRSISLLKSNREIIEEYKLIPFRLLLSKLEDKNAAEDGFLNRDLALSVLHHIYYFDLDKALPLKTRQVRAIEVQGEYFKIFPALTDLDFAAIIQFSQTETWPLMPQGLFEMLKLSYPYVEPSLQETFFLSEEFIAIYSLFQKNQATISKKRILEMLLQANWQSIDTFFKFQKKEPESIETKRQNLLLAYLDMQSPIAAELLLETDYEFAVKRLDDTRVLNLLHLLPKKTFFADLFAKDILISPRKDLVWQTANLKLHAFSNIPSPQVHCRKSAIALFISQKDLTLPTHNSSNASSVQKLPVSRRTKIHVIEDGDSLWKISRKYHIDTETLKQFNGLKDDRLVPGQVLKIPAN